MFSTSQVRQCNFIELTNFIESKRTAGGEHVNWTNHQWMSTYKKDYRFCSVGQMVPPQKTAHCSNIETLNIQCNKWMPLHTLLLDRIECPSEFNQFSTTFFFLFCFYIKWSALMMPYISLSLSCSGFYLNQGSIFIRRWLSGIQLNWY